MKLRTAIAIAALALTAAPAVAAPKLDMLAFFTGKTHAENVMRVALKKPAKLVVDSFGGKGDRGDFVLVDTVREEGQPVRTRKWVMKLVAPGHYTGALSDAVGPVDVQVDGSRAVIRYKMKGGLNVTQQLDMQDGRTMSNRVNVRKFGLKFASVEGTIRKLD
jgi:hypothetical protein